MLRSALRRISGALPTILPLLALALSAGLSADGASGSDGLARAAAALVPTLPLVAGAVVGGGVLGTALGLLAALRPGPVTRALVSALVAAGVVLPAFAVAALLATAVPESPADAALALVALVVPAAATSARAAVEAMGRLRDGPAVLAARARGVPAATALASTAITPSLAAAAQAAGRSAAAATAAVVVAESLFGLPGAGRLFLAAVQGGEIDVALAAFALLALVAVLFEALGDALADALLARGGPW